MCERLTHEGTLVAEESRWGDVERLGRKSCLVCVTKAKAFQEF